MNLYMIIVRSSKCIGIEAVPVNVEVNISSGIGIHLVGLADAAVKESLLRTITALQSRGFHIPGKKIVINLAPADIRKNGSIYDLPIALGIIAASGQMSMDNISNFMILGELGLDATVRYIPGALPAVELACNMGMSGCILPYGAAFEVREFAEIPVYGVRHLEDVLKILDNSSNCDEFLAENLPCDTYCNNMPNNGLASGGKGNSVQTDDTMDFCDIFGQPAAKRGLEIAAAGGHNVLMIGPPGSGKSSLAKATSAILPPMSRREAICTSKIYSITGNGMTLHGLIWKRPFRSPHYSSSITSIIGGGYDNILPGEISLAHNGILFLDEFCEIPRKTIEALRAPLEERKVTISRLKNKVSYPASFILIAATNPCPCGYYGDGDKCVCSPAKRAGYLSRLSGPIMDRIDIHLWINPVRSSDLLSKTPEESSREIAARVMNARKIQQDRFSSDGISCNAEMNGRLIRKYCKLDTECRDFMAALMDRNSLSARACGRIIKLARTIADLEDAGDITLKHLGEASRYRLLDKKDLLL